MQNPTAAPLALAVIGGGAMGGALLRGIIRAGGRTVASIGVSDPNRQLGESLAAELGVQYLSDNAMAAGADIVLLAVKPQVFATVVEELRPHLRSSCVVSILAGISLLQLEAAFPGRAVVRVMPNTPALVGAGMSVLSLGTHVSVDLAADIESLFAGVGRVLTVPETLMDAVTAVSGSGPGFLAVILEALIDGGVSAGLPRAIATELAFQTALGTAKLLQTESLHPAILKDRVTSPGGTTIAGIAALERGGVRAALIDAVRAATERSRQLRESN
ncbi:MAG: pyrroline-5-carboxylate reductase [Cyanobacteria bacterium P01_D01_bin.123]